MSDQTSALQALRLSMVDLSTTDAGRIIEAEQRLTALAAQPSLLNNGTDTADLRQLLATCREMAVVSSHFWETRKARAVSGAAEKNRSNQEWFA
jgi:hypothetical protein